MVMELRVPIRGPSLEPLDMGCKTRAWVLDCGMEVFDSDIGKSAVPAFAARLPYSCVPCFVVVLLQIAGRQEGGKMQVNLCTASSP